MTATSISRPMSPGPGYRSGAAKIQQVAGPDQREVRQRGVGGVQGDRALGPEAPAVRQPAIDGPGHRRPDVSVRLGLGHLLEEPSVGEKDPAVWRDQAQFDHPREDVDGQVVRHFGRWGLRWSDHVGRRGLRWNDHGRGGHDSALCLHQPARDDARRRRSFRVSAYSRSDLESRNRTDPFSLSSPKCSPNRRSRGFRRRVPAAPRRPAARRAGRRCGRPTRGPPG